ncbi:threonine synthase [Runella sp.]|uniref:threonine synthase n=1 Tax=Runella sp. TaxID=1960881 RepID=UPI003D0AE0A5
MVTESTLSHAVSVKCSACEKEYALNELLTFSPCCTKPLLVNYDLTDLSKEALLPKTSLWRYEALLPVMNPENIVSLGEGMTPILSLQRLSGEYGFEQLYLKDESANPTGSFKARGMSVAISKAKELGIQRCIVPTAGNAGGAMSAYCAKAGMEATVVMPAFTPRLFKEECRNFGANVVEVNGLIDACGQKVRELREKDPDLFDVSTMKEPYRLEGKKTMGFEIAEQFEGTLPDVIIYPTGGGTGLIGIWKAFEEMRTLGWIAGKLPRMVAIQAANCAPIWSDVTKEEFLPKPSLANGLAVPYPFAKGLILSVLEESKGGVYSVTEEELIAGTHELMTKEGIFAAPEGGAIWAGLKKMLRAGVVKRSEKILLINTGSAYKYMENLAR